jgi:uncharacterized protein (DUF58 family)
MAVSGVLGKWNLSRVEVRFLLPDEIFDGLPTLLGVELVNHRRWLPLFLMEIVLGDGSVFFPLVDARGKRRKSLEFTFVGRGYRPLPEVRLRSRFPVNFFIRSQGLAMQQQALVFPRPQPCVDPRQAAPDGGPGAVGSGQRGYEGEIYRISDYQGGEPLKSIHWKLTARHDQIKVKELSATTRKPIILDLEQLPGATIEQRLCHASFLVVRWLRQGWPVGLKSVAGELAPAAGVEQKRALLKVLACYGQNQTAA